MSGSGEAVERGQPVESQEPHPDIDQLLVASISRWALAIAGLVVLFDALLLAGYPFPGFLDAARGLVYALFGVAVLLGVAAVSFLGYRIVTMRVVRSRRTMWVIFLPAVLLLASVGGFLLLSAPK